MSNRYIPELWEKRFLKQLMWSFWDKMFGKRSRTWGEREQSGEANDVVRIRTKPDLTLDSRPDDVDCLKACQEVRERLESEMASIKRGRAGRYDKSENCLLRHA